MGHFIDSLNVQMAVNIELLAFGAYPVCVYCLSNYGVVVNNHIIALHP